MTTKLNSLYLSYFMREINLIAYNEFHKTSKNMFKKNVMYTLGILWMYFLRVQSFRPLCVIFIIVKLDCIPLYHADTEPQARVTLALRFFLSSHTTIGV